MSSMPGRPGAYIEEVPGGPPAIAGVDSAVTAFVGGAVKGPVDRPIRIHGFGDYAGVFGGLDDGGPMAFAVHHYFANGGRVAVVVRVAAGGGDAAGGLPGSRSRKTGIYALEDADHFGLLCLPPPSPSVDVPGAAWAAAADYCRERRAMLLVDPPAAVRDPAAMVRHVEALPAMAKENAAAYFPGILMRNPTREGSIEPFAPGGAVAGVIARIDARRGVWKAPAGREATLSGAAGLSHDLTRRGQSRLNPRGINGLRTFPRIGTVIWGARTLDGSDGAASEWKYVAVRRLALYVEASVYRGTEWAVFEPNDEPLWSRLRHAVEAFMHGLFRNGAFQGATPGEAYFVRCGRDTTTRNDLDSGLVEIQIGFAPLQPAEFVVLRIVQKTGEPPRR